MIPNKPQIVYDYVYKGVNKFSDFTTSKAMKFGSAVDCLLTTNTFWDKYIVLEGKIPTPMMSVFIHTWIETGDPISAHLKSKYSSRTSTQTLLTKAENEFSEYIDSVKNNKIMINEKEFAEIQEAVTKIDESPFRTLFTNQDNLHQFEVIFDYRGFECRGTIDILEINHTNKTLRVVDLKTSKSIFTFESSYKEFLYYRQVSFYTYGIEQWKHTVNYSDYEVLNPAFLVVDREYPYALMYTTTEKYKGMNEVDELLDLFAWHVENNVFVNKVHYENNFIMTLS